MSASAHAHTEDRTHVRSRGEGRPQHSSSPSFHSRFYIIDMTLFSPRYTNVSGELKSSRSRAASKRTNSSTYGSDVDLDYDSYHEDYYDRVYESQRVPASLSPVPLRTSPVKRPRSSCYSKQRHSRDRSHSKSSRPNTSSSNTAKLGVEELQVIKKELTLIKTQIDGLLDSLDRMDTQRTEQKESPQREESPAGSLYSPSASSPELSHSSLSPPYHHQIHRESPELETDDYLTTSNHHS